MAGSHSPERSKNLARILAMHLWSTQIPAEYPGVTIERRFQEWVGDHIQKWLEENRPRLYRVNMEPKGGGVTPVKAFGTSFWPDVSVESADGDPVVAVEIKCVKRQSLSARLSQGLGQALMYQQVYPQSLVVLVPLERLPMPPPPFFANVGDHDIEMSVVGWVGGSGVDAHDR